MSIQRPRRQTRPTRNVPPPGGFPGGPGENAPPTYGRPVCDLCGAGIIFVRARKSGKPQPLNPAPVVVPPDAEPGDDRPTNLVVRDQDGFGTLVHRPPPNAVGFVSHFATCPVVQRRRRMDQARRARKKAGGSDASPTPVQLGFGF